MAKESRKTLTSIRGTIMASAIACIALPGISHAASFTFDGVDSGAGDMYTNANTFTAKWWNGHDQDNFPKDGSQPETTIKIGTGSDNGTGIFTWLLIEAPIYAKNMVWGASADPYLGPDEYDLDPGEMDFDKATGSEGVLFGAQDLGDGKTKDITGGTWLDLAKKDSPAIIDNSPWTVLDFRDSVDYLLGAGSGECNSLSTPAQDCGAGNRTMSFEVKLAALDAGGLTALRNNITDNGVAFHLSPDRNGEPPDMSKVPVPAAFWLFGTALIGFIGISRRTKVG